MQCRFASTKIMNDIYMHQPKSSMLLFGASCGQHPHFHLASPRPHLQWPRCRCAAVCAPLHVPKALKTKQLRLHRVESLKQALVLHDFLSKSPDRWAEVCGHYSTLLHRFEMRIEFGQGLSVVCERFLASLKQKNLRRHDARFLQELVVRCQLPFQQYLLALIVQVLQNQERLAYNHKNNQFCRPLHYCNTNLSKSGEPCQHPGFDPRSPPR